MKKITFLFVAVLLTLSQIAVAGGKKDGFNGTVKYKITVEGRELTPTEQSQYPTNLDLYYLGNMVRQDNISPMASYGSIVNMDTYDTKFLFDMMGQKLYTDIDGSKLKAIKDSLQENTKNNVTILEGTKTIAGYTCKKAEIAYGEGEQQIKITVYYTEEIKAKHPEFEELSGFPLYYAKPLGEDGVEMVFQATEVSTKKPKKKIFKASSDYEEMTPEMKKQMGFK